MFFILGICTEIKENLKRFLYLYRMVTHKISENDRTHWRSDQGNVPRDVRYKQPRLSDSSGMFSTIFQFTQWPFN